MTTDVAKLRRKRTRKRNAAVATISEVDEWLVDTTTESSERKIELSCRLETLVEDSRIVKDLDAQIFDLIDEDVEAEEDGKSAAAHNLKVSICIKKIETFLTTKEQEAYKAEMNNGFVFGATSPRSFGQHTGVKLPKIKIKKFEGDITEWKSFLDTFEAAVDTKDDLTKIEKFTYLKGYLGGIALQSIEGFPLSNENYDQAFALLKERYGNKQLIISTHMNNLIKLEGVNSCSVSQLRQ